MPLKSLQDQMYFGPRNGLWLPNCLPDGGDRKIFQSDFENREEERIPWACKLAIGEWIDCCWLDLSIYRHPCTPSHR